jgi:queuine tRNA-ribosyltransferase
VRGGKLNIGNARHRTDDSAVEPGCPCECCTTYSRAYLSHLYHSKELLFYRLATVHNLRHYLDLARGARAAILAGTFAEYRAGYLRTAGSTEAGPDAAVTDRVPDSTED